MYVCSQVKPSFCADTNFNVKQEGFTSPLFTFCVLFVTRFCKNIFFGCVAYTMNRTEISFCQIFAIGLKMTENTRNRQMQKSPVLHYRYKYKGAIILVIPSVHSVTGVVVTLILSSSLCTCVSGPCNCHRRLG